MATTPPSAAPGVDPSAAGVEGEGEGEVQQHLPDPSKVRKGEAKLPRQIKPIKTKVQLPGVDTGFDGASAFDSKLAKALGRSPETGEGLDTGDGREFGEEKPESKPEKATPQRGADGKFLKAVDDQERAAEEKMAEEAKAEGEPAPEEAIETPEPPEEEGEPETIETVTAKLRDTEQRYKSLQGMFKPLQVKHQTAITEQHKAAKSAIAWKAAHDALAEENAQLRQQLESGGRTPVSGQDQRTVARTGDDAYDAIIKGVDWSLYEDVKKQGDDAVAVWLARQILDLSRKEREAELAKLREEWRADLRQPEEDKARRNEIAQHALEVFSRVADVKDSNGEFVFPELYDEAEAYKVGEMWTQLYAGADEETRRAAEKFLLTPAGVVQAILSYRFYSGKSPSPPTTAEEPPPDEEVEEEEESEPVTIPARALRGMPGARASAPLRPTLRTGDGDEASRIKSAMRETSEIDNLFGFPTRKSARR